MNIVFIHGAWHTARVWDALLTEFDSFNTIALNMPARVYETTKAYRKIDLSTYVEGVEQCIDTLNGPITLVGHSLAGLTISQVAERHPKKIAQLIYVTAFIPYTNESMFDITSKIKNPGISPELIFDPKANRVDVHPSEQTKCMFYNTCDPKIANDAVLHLNPEPLKAFTTPVRLTPENFGTVKKVYIKCLQDKALLPVDQDMMIQKTNIHHVFEIDTDHSPFISDSRGLTSLIKKALAL